MAGNRQKEDFRPTISNTDGLLTLEVGGETFACWSRQRLPVNALRWLRNPAFVMKSPAMGRYVP